MASVQNAQQRKHFGPVYKRSRRTIKMLCDFNDHKHKECHNCYHDATTAKPECKAKVLADRHAATQRWRVKYRCVYGLGRLRHHLDVFPHIAILFVVRLTSRLGRRFAKHGTMGALYLRLHHLLATFTTPGTGSRTSCGGGSWRTVDRTCPSRRRGWVRYCRARRHWRRCLRGPQRRHSCQRARPSS